MDVDSGFLYERNIRYAGQGMNSFLGWLDHDPEERERMNRVLSLFQESESRDELGLGPIRESISDQLFPGTSVLQTRLRYFLLVPWIYRRLEDDRVPSVDIARKARKAEIGLIESLLANDDDKGVLGKRARGALKLLPSSAYWNGLESWGIRRFPRSQDDYHRAFDRMHRRGPARRRDDGDLETELVASWDPALPGSPSTFPDEASFALTSDEALYMRDRIVMSHPESLLAWLARADPFDEVEAPWQHPRLADFRSDHRELLHHAHIFSAVTQGAAIVYNVALARIANNAARREEHEATLERWVADLHDLPLDGWSLERFWFLVHHRRHAIGIPTQEFVRVWTRLAACKTIDAVSSVDAHDLVQRRERMLKGARSRYVNRRALDQWSGWSALSPATFRWGTAQRLLADLYRGLGED